MSWRDRTELAVAVLLGLLPFVANVILWVHRKKQLQVKPWRYRLATIGLALDLVASFPTPLFFFSIALPWGIKAAWFATNAITIMTVSMIAGLIATILLGFGRSWVRWLGMSTAFFSTCALYIILLGLSD
jgi:hypothetical protein